MGMNCSFCAAATDAMPARSKPSKAGLRDFMVFPPRKIVFDYKPNPHRIGQTHCGVNAKAASNRRPRSRVTVWCAAKSMRERPKAKLLLADLPQAGKAIRLDDQEKDDQRTEDNHLDIGHQSGR